MQTASSGITLRQQPVSRPGVIGCGAMAAALFAVGMLALGSMVQATVPMQSLAAGCAAAAGLAVLPRGKLRWGLGIIALAAALCALLMPAAFVTGVKLLGQRVFIASEAANRYRYMTITLPENAALLQQAAQLTAVLGVMLGAGLCAVCVHHHAAMALTAAGMAVLQMYFGIVPDWVWQTGWFALCGIQLLGGAAKDQAAIAVLCACAALAVSLLCPGVDAQLETASEALRDWLDAGAAGVTAAEGLSDAVNHTRLENRLGEAEVGLEGQEQAAATDYEKIIRYQDEISAPHMLNLRAVVLGLLAVLAVLVVPFVPFYWWDRRNKQALARRMAFDAEDASQAVQAMLAQIVRCLGELVTISEDAAMHDLPDIVKGRVPDPMLAQLRVLIPVWYRAAYSDHPVADEERQAVAALLHQVEAYLLQSADWRKRLRLKYVAMLLPVEVDA